VLLSARPTITQHRAHWSARPQPQNFAYTEWITLHDRIKFRGLVDFLRVESGGVGRAQADLCRDLVARAVALELAFSEATLYGPGSIFMSASASAEWFCD
jgi:hypothetical protein